MQTSSKPHIILIVGDDIGWADISYNNEILGDKAIPTVNIDKLSSRGIRLTQHYVQSTCTPSRASLMTGRYACNTGLVFAMLPGSLEGLPAGMITLPEVMRSAGYRTHMVGKWHIGHSQWSQTPVGKGFETHVGSYMWSMDHYTKEMYSEPWNLFAIDWVRAFENGTYEHYAETRHTTQVLTEEAQQVIINHQKENEADVPLFLYLAYTAAHAPLVPRPQDEAPCQHLAHLWRRKFCAMMVGLDEGISNVTNTIEKYLGANTILVFLSDNGGAPWFGGLNYPLRSGKTTPFEGGVRVPAFVVDFTNDGKYLGPQHKYFDGLMHISDWLPTLASLGGIKNKKVFQGMDGKDMGSTLKSGNIKNSPRKSILLEMYYASKGEFIFPEDVVAYRKGKYKLIESINLRDPHWYSESIHNDALNTTDKSLVAWFGEKIIRYFERMTSVTHFDTLKDMLVHVVIHKYYAYFPPQSSKSLMLFDLSKDPGETTNIASKNMDVVKELQEEVNVIMVNRPEQAKFWMTIDRDKEWEGTLKPSNKCGDDSDCRKKNVFTHPWVSDNADLDALKTNLVDGAAAGPFIHNILTHFAKTYFLYVIVSIIAIQLIYLETTS